MKTLTKLVIAALVSGVALTIQAQPITAQVDFEGLNEGDIVSSLTLGAGYTSTEDLGTIGVSGTNPKKDLGNAAMIFNSDCDGLFPDPCSGGDPDLASGNGKVLIVTEDFDATDPDDALGGILEFDFSSLTDGVVDVDSLQITDTEEGGTIELYNGLILLATIDLPLLADGETAAVDVDVSNVTFMRVTLIGSGSVDSVEFSIDRREFGGCTPGFWKNRAVRAGYWDDTGYLTGDLYSDVFGVVTDPVDLSLLEALQQNGNSEGEALLRHSTAALLNAAHPDIHYPYSESEIINLTAAAWADGTKDVLNEVKDTFDDANNAGCFD